MSDLRIISRKDAIASGSKRYFTGKPCKNGHISERICGDRSCVDCSRNNCKKHYYKNRGKSVKRVQEWKAKNPESAKKHHEDCYLRNRDKRIRGMKDWASRNPEKTREIQKRYRSKTKHLSAARLARRRAAKINATPKWLTKEQKREINNFYKEAERLELETGIKHHVDHIVPLRGDNVSGLHVPWNLQVISAIENLKKSNKLYDRT